MNVIDVTCHDHENIKADRKYWVMTSGKSCSEENYSSWIFVHGRNSHKTQINLFTVYSMSILNIYTICKDLPHRPIEVLWIYKI